MGKFLIEWLQELYITFPLVCDHWIGEMVCFGGGALVGLLSFWSKQPARNVLALIKFHVGRGVFLHIGREGPGTVRGNAKPEVKIVPGTSFQEHVKCCDVTSRECE